MIDGDETSTDHKRREWSCARPHHTADHHWPSVEERKHQVWRWRAADNWNGGFSDMDWIKRHYDMNPDHVD